MGPGTIGEVIAIVGILAVLVSIGGLATGEVAPVDLELVSWGGAGLTIAGMFLMLVGN